jgi:hypothetical protein
MDHCRFFLRIQTRQTRTDLPCYGAAFSLHHNHPVGPILFADRVRAEQAVQCYEEAPSTARVEFPAPNSLWLAVAFNYSVFLFETQRQSKQAISVARTVLEDSAGLTNSGNDTEFKEATRLQ